MTYEQHVREVAEEMARIHKGHLSSFDEPGYETKKYWTNWYLPYARVAVRLQLESFKDAYAMGMSDCGVDFLAEDPDLNQALIERGLIPAPEVKKCDHKNCNYGRCNVTNEPICGCCGAYVNTVMTEDEKREDMQQLFDASEINVHKVTERGYLCYNSTLSCDRPRSCQFYKCCAYPQSNRQK